MTRKKENGFQKISLGTSKVKFASLTNRFGNGEKIKLERIVLFAYKMCDKEETCNCHGKEMLNFLRIQKDLCHFFYSPSIYLMGNWMY